METLVLIGGFLYMAAVGYFAMDRLGRFLDEGGVSPYWDEEEERLAKMKKQEPVDADFLEILDDSAQPEDCNTPRSGIK
nr:hypothetical protein [uncultured Oscillibacter sp.]